MNTIPIRDDYEALCPASPQDLGFDVEGWWPGQRQTIGRVVAAYLEGNDTVLLNAPPGSGKTLVAAAVGRIMQLQTVTMTHTLQLQDQYLRTATWARTLKGKSNYPCGLPDLQDGAARVRLVLGRSALTADDCDEYIGCGDPWKHGCPYFAAVGKAADSDSVILNYSYATRIAGIDVMKRGVCEDELEEAHENPFLRPLAVLDEGHLANDAIVDACALEFWNGTLQRVGVKSPKSTDPTEWNQWARDQLADDANTDWGTRFEKQGDIVTAARARTLRGRLRTLAKIEPHEWLVRPQDKFTIVQPIWARAVTRRFLDKFPKLLIMSATLGNPDLLVAKLGLEAREHVYVDVPSTFPLVNRPIFFWPVVKLSAKSEEGDYEAVASAISFIASQPNLAGRKGIIHTGSYKLVRRLAPYLRDEPRFLLHEEAVTRGALVSLFTKEDFPYAIVTPSLSTGFDLPYQVGWQVVAKVPFADLSDPLVSARRDASLPGNDRFGKRSYDDDAVNQIIQAAGRAVRAPDDNGVTYILDGHFWGLYKRAFSPGYFKEAITWVN